MAAGGHTTLLPADPRRRRIMIALAGAAVLALVVVLQRRSAAAATAPAAAVQAATDPNAGAASLPQSSFADNGSYTTGLSDALTTGLGNVQTSLDNVGTALQGMASLSEAQPGTTDPSTTNAPSPVTVNVMTAPGPGGNSSPAKKTAAAATKARVDPRGHTAAQRAAIRKKKPAAAKAYDNRLTARARAKKKK